MSIEKSQEQLQNKTSVTEYAANAIKNIRSLGGDIDIDTAFPRMSELMDIPDSSKTFQKISDASQICKGQNGAVDREKMKRMCAAIDPDAS